jgi:uncharacterized membrane protein
MDIKHHLEAAWNLTLNNFVSLILISVVMMGVSILTVGIMAPVTMAGYMQSLLEMIRSGREPKVQDLFSHMNMFLPMLAFGAVVFTIIFLGFMAFFLPGVILTGAVAFCCLYMMPLMTDRNLGVFASIKESMAMSRRVALTDHLAVVIVFLVIYMMGRLAFIGMLFTMPLSMLFLLSTYEERINAPPPAAPQQP